jgi:DNA-binding NarL/FixJ family response regulator
MNDRHARWLAHAPVPVVLIVEDDASYLLQLQKVFRMQGMSVIQAVDGISGLQATRKILQHAPETLILMLSMHAEETWVRQAMDAGARGYVLKNAMDLELGSTIRRMVNGETVLDGQLSRQENLKGERNSGLTPREVEILQLICEGKSNKEIALQLELSANTVAVHRANIMDALGIHKTAELVVYAIRNGLVNVP